MSTQLSTCPQWCRGDHSLPELYPQDLDHRQNIYDRPDEDDHNLLQVGLSWRPFALTAEERQPMVLMLVGDDLASEMTPAEARAAASGFGRGDTDESHEVAAALRQAADVLDSGMDVAEVAR